VGACNWHPVRWLADGTAILERRLHHYHSGGHNRRQILRHPCSTRHRLHTRVWDSSNYTVYSRSAPKQSAQIAMMPMMCYIVGWALVYICTSSAVSVIRERFGQEELRGPVLGKRGRRIALFPGCVALFSALSLLIWAALHATWYHMLLGWAAGLLVSGAVQQLVSPAKLLVWAPTGLACVNVLLWIFQIGRGVGRNH